MNSIIIKNIQWQCKVYPHNCVWINTRKSLSVIHIISRLKEKNHMIISTYAPKAWSRNSSSFLIKKLKAFSKEGLKRSPLNLIRGAHQTLTGNIIYINRILEVSQLRLRRYLLHALLLLCHDHVWVAYVSLPISLRVLRYASADGEASQGAQWAKNPPLAVKEMQETWVQSQNWEDPLEKGMATHSTTLACRIPWTEEPGGLHSTGLQRIIHYWSDWACAHACRR